MTTDLNQVWKAVLGELEVILSQANFHMWFKDTFIIEYNDPKIVIASPNAFNRDWIKDKYHKKILLTIKKHLPNIKEADYRVASRQSAPKKIIIDQAPKPAEKNNHYTPHTNLNQLYIFDNFVIGNTNRFAAASAQAVAEKPGQLHNPLFIYGGVGLGKTHLAQAIGHDIIRRHPTKKIMYVTCETFTNDFVSGISTGRMKEFKKNYREVDVLIIDDIQFIANKEGSQEEFFHTYNTLHQTSRQIVITADKPPKSISALEERLKSRFGSGLLTDIQPPDLETRLAIIKNKAQSHEVNFNEDTLLYIAQNVRSNIRELTGAFNKVATHAQLYRENPTIALCDELLKDIFTPKENVTSVEKIITTTCKYYNLPPSDLIGKKRQKILVTARQITMYLMRHELSLSYPLIGKELGGKDHTTIIHGAEKIEKEIIKNPKLKSEIITIKEMMHTA